MVEFNLKSLMRSLQRRGGFSGLSVISTTKPTWLALWPAADAIEGFPPKGQAGVEWNRGVVEVAVFKGTGTVSEQVGADRKSVV